MINMAAEIFANPPKTGAAPTRPRRTGFTEVKTSNTTNNGKNNEWGKITI